MRENICKQHKQVGVNIQNIRRAHKTQYQKTVQSKRIEDLVMMFTKKDIQVMNRHEMMPSIANYREMQVKTTTTVILTLVRMAIIKMSTNVAGLILTQGPNYT